MTDDSLSTTSGGAGWHSHSYDDRGNMTRSGSSLNNAHTMFMTYDMSDQMTAMSGHNLQEAPLTATYQYNGAGKRVYTNHNGRQSYPMYDAGGALRSVYKVHDGEWADRISLENGHPLAKWTTTTLTYLHADHLGTPIRGTHGLGGTGLAPGDESFQDFSTPYGLNPTSGWWGNGGSGFDPITGSGSNCGVTGFTTHAKDCESGLQYMQARHYSPVSARFMSVDPVGFMTDGRPGMVNRFQYSSSDPINRIDPDGEADIFVGGFFDGATKNVLGYQKRWSQRRPNRTGSYHQPRQFSGVVTALTAAQATGEPVNAACHSMGCATLYSAIEYTGVEVDNLVTVDPVNDFYGQGGGARPENVKFWTNIEGTPTEGSHNFSDRIEGIGELLGEFDTSGADAQISTTENHANFSRMFQSTSNTAPSGVDRFDNSYTRTGTKLRKYN